MAGRVGRRGSQVLAFLGNTPHIVLNMSITCEPDATPPPAKPKRRRWPPLPRPYTRAELDKRTAAYQMFERLVADIIRDVGGEGEVSAVRYQLIEAFCGMAIRMNDMSSRSLAGQPVDLSELSLAASTLTRLATRIGLKRAPRDVTPPRVEDYIAHINNKGSTES